ncbi:MAG TPA: hypothetical protein VFS55_05710 [Dokdonella sp.]|nr:hypothetical protein [Dokdonella sp.]
MHRLPSVLIAAVVVAGCAVDKMRSKENILEQTLHSYAATIRWGDVSQALAFIDPKVLAEHPPSPLDLERFKQVRVTGYSEQPIVPVGEEEVRQVVQIELANVNTQSVRSIVDHQVWKYDEATKHWWLTSGLPDIARHE